MKQVTRLRYVGRSDLRTLTSEDIRKAYDIDHKSIAASRNQRIVKVSEELGAALVKEDEWEMSEMETYYEPEDPDRNDPTPTPAESVDEDSHEEAEPTLPDREGEREGS